MESIIYEGIIATHDREPFKGQIKISRKTGLIESVIEIKDKDKEANIIFEDNYLMFPGMGDVHIHAREDRTGEQTHKETYIGAANAALNGGVTHVSAMPNTPIPLTTEEEFKWHREKVKETNHPVSILNYVGIGVGTKPLGKPGEHFYKAYFGKSVGDLTFYDENELREALKNYRGHHVSFHVEYQPIIDKNTNQKNHSKRRPVECVEEGLRLLLPLIEEFELNAKLCHWSTGGKSFDMIDEHRERNKEKGLPYTTLEVSPLHLIFDTSMTDLDPSLWLKIQMNPAIQTSGHRKQLIEGLKSGFIDYIATDHAPHTLEEKHKAFNKFKEEYPNLSNIEIAEKVRKENPKLFLDTCCEDGSSGAPWLDTYISVVGWLMKEHKFKPSDIARVTGYNPGKFVNNHLENQFEKSFGKGFGEIKEGFFGALTVIDPDKEKIIKDEDTKTVCSWTPLNNLKVPGTVRAVIIGGIDRTKDFL